MAALAGLLGMFGLCLPAMSAAPAQAATQSTQAQVQAQINSLGNQIATLDEQYDEATIHLQSLQVQIHDSQAASAQAESSRAALQATASKQAAAIYEEGAPDIMITFLTSKNLDAFNQRMELISQVSDYESGVMNSLQIADQKAAQATTALDSELAQAQSVSSTLSKERTSLSSQLAQQQTLLAQINAATRAAEAAAAQARATAAQAALAKAAAAAAAARASAAAKSSVGSLSSVVGSVGAVPPAVAADLPSSSGASIALQVAMAQVGKPYVWAGSGPATFDCSGLTMFAWRAAGVLLPHSAAGQYASLPHVNRANLQPGDLVFFGSPIHHVGMFVGGNSMVDAPETGEDVQVQPIQSNYVGAARP